MAPFPVRARPEDVPLDVLFPEDYRHSARMIVRDFAFFGGFIVAAIAGCAFFFRM